jgi:tetratricopeptide (TPR) repeat protein
MRKDHARRYRSAAELADDVRNYFDGAPLIAGPESTLYRLKKSVHRNRALVIGISSVLVVLVAGIVASTVLAISADRSRAETERQAMISQAVADFLTDDLLGSVDPEKAKSPEVTVRSVLDAASKSLEGKFEGKPLIEASIREKLGETYLKLGDYKAAEPHLERAYRIRAEQLGEEDLSTQASVYLLGTLYLAQARHDDAEPLLVGTWQIRRRLLGEEHPDTLASALQVASLSLFYGSSAVSDLEGLFSETLETARGVLGDEHLVTLSAMFGLSTAYLFSDRNEEAELLYARGLETAERVLSAEHELTLWFMDMSAALHFDQGRYDQGAQLVTRAFEISQRVLGDEHPTTIHSMFMRGAMYRYQEQDDEAEPLLEESVQLSRRVLGDEHFFTLLYMHHLALLYRDQGRYEDAEQLLVKVFEGRLQLLGEKHGLTQRCIIDLCLLHEMSGQLDKLETLFLSNSKLFERQRMELDQDDAVLAGHLNGHAWRQATYPEAELRNGPEAIENATKACELTNWKTGRYVDTLAAAYAEASDFASAIEWQKKAIDLLTEEERPRQRRDYESRLKLYESGQPARQSFVRGLAWDIYCQGRYAEAERMLVKALEFSRRVFGEEHSETRACQQHFVELYEAWGKPEKAKEWRTKLPVMEDTEK